MRAARQALRAAGWLGLLALAGCAADREVYVYLPVARMELPTQPARTFSGSLAYASEASLLLTPDHTRAAPDPDAPRIDDESDARLRFDVSMTDNLSVGARAFAKDLYGAQLKIGSAWGHERHGLAKALTVGYGWGAAEYHYSTGGNGHFDTELEQDWIDAGLVLGMAAGERGMVYGGPFFARHRYDGVYRTGQGDVHTVDPVQGDARIAGFNLGYVFQLLAQRFFAELGVSSIEAGRAKDSLVQLGVSYEFSFGPLRAPASPAARRAPVEVVQPVAP